MKKTLFAFAALLALSFCAAAEDAPAFDGENAYVIDAAGIAGAFKDNVLVVDKAQEEAVSVTVFAYKDGAWQEIGAKAFTRFDEELKIKAKKPARLSDSRYFAVQAADGFSAAYKVEKRRNDLCIEVRSAGSDLQKPACPAFAQNPKAFVFDAAALDDDADENLKITGYLSAGGEVTFRVYAYDAKKRAWIVWGTADIGHNGDTEKVKGGKHDDLDDYRYFAVEALNGQDYKYMPLVKDNDLFVNVSL